MHILNMQVSFIIHVHVCIKNIVHKFHSFLF